MLAFSLLLYWCRRWFLSLLGLTAPIKLVHDAGNCTLGDQKHSQSLLQLLKSHCPSLIGHKAWYSGSFWLFGSGHLQVLFFVGIIPMPYPAHVLVENFAHQKTAYSAVGDFSKVHKVEYERKVGYVSSCFPFEAVRFSLQAVSECPGRRDNMH